jgi:hypothetical protein
MITNQSGKFTLILDSTQLANYSACPTMWELGDRRLLLRNDIALKDNVRDDRALDMGTYGHKLQERYYQAYRHTIENQTEALEYALAVNMDRIHCECGHGADVHCADPHLGLGISCSVGDCMCEEFKPAPFPLNQEKRQLVKQKFCEYIYKWTATGDFDVQSPRHVEVGFSELLYEDSERIYILEGRMDIASCLYNGTEVVVDHKWQVRRKDLYLKRIQFRNYAMVARKPFLLVNYCRLAKEVSSDTFKRAIASFTKPEMDWWRTELIKTYHEISGYLMYPLSANLLSKNVLSPRREWGNCETGNGYAACQFTPLCEEAYLGPRMMTNRIEQLYTVRKEWRPW